MTDAPPISFPVDLNQLQKKKKMSFTVTATPEQCAALAARLGILDVKKMTGTIHVSMAPVAGNIRLEGELDAVVVQACAMSFQPVKEKVVETFAETLTTLPDNLIAEDEITGDDDVPVDVIEGDSFDAGEILTQWLSLSLNPFPRSDAPTFEHNETARAEDGTLLHTPFDVLGRLKSE